MQHQRQTDGAALVESVSITATGKQEGLLGRRRFRIPERAGCVAVVVVGNRAVLLSKFGDDGCVPADQATDAFVVYLRLAPVPVVISVDGLLTQDGWMASGDVRFSVGIPSDEADRERLAYLWADPESGGLDAKRIAEEVRFKMRAALREIVHRQTADDLQKSPDAPFGEIETKADVYLTPALQALGTMRQGVVSGQLVAKSPEAVDPGLYEKLRDQAMQDLGEASDLAKVVYLLSTLTSSSQARLKLWVEKEGAEARKKQATRGIGVIKSGRDTDAGHFARNQQIFLDVFSTVDGYLHLLDMDAEGGLSLIFPNALCPDNHIPANKRFTLPDDAREMFGGDDARWAILPDSPPGVERLKAILTVENVSLLPRVGGEEFLYYARPAAQAHGDLVAMIEKLHTLGSQKWTDAFCQFRIVG